MKATPKVLAYRIKLASRGPTNLPGETVISEALNHKIYVAWSGGRCSTIALHLAIQQCPDIPVAFNNTGVEYPETVKYVRKIAKKWNLNYHELKPETTFWKLVKEHGFPQLRGSGSSGRPRKPACCYHLKEKPGNKFASENGFEGIITGIRVEESRARALTVYQKGQLYFVSRDNLWKFHPVSLWSLEKLMDYARENDIPLNPLYKEGYERVGCMPCTGFTEWREQLSTHRPRYYKWLNREYQKMQGIPTLWEYADAQGCRQEAVAI